MAVSELPLREVHFAHGRITIHLAIPRSADELIDEEAFARDERLPFWADLWPSSLAICRWLIDQPPINSRVIELGCGMGLPSLVMSALGMNIVASDYEQDALDCVTMNVQHNHLKPLPTRVLDWRDEAVGKGDDRFDLAIGTDLLYEQRNAIALADLLPRIIAPGGRCVIADPGRRWLPQFQLLMRERKWSITELATIIEPGTGSDATPSHVRIIECKPQAASR